MDRSADQDKPQQTVKPEDRKGGKLAHEARGDGQDSLSKGPAAGGRLNQWGQEKQMATGEGTEDDGLDAGQPRLDEGSEGGSTNEVKVDPSDDDKPSQGV